MPIEVVNKYRHPPTSSDVYIGRGSVLGNPFTGSRRIEKTKAQFQCESRESAIEAYQAYLLRKIQSRDPAVCRELNRIFLKAKQEIVYLVCYCAPKRCHGDVIRQIIEDKLNPK
jgi:hypothetical protein